MVRMQDLRQVNHGYHLDLHPLLLEPFPHLELVEMLVWKMMVDLVLVEALRILWTHILNGHVPYCNAWSLFII